MMQHTPHNRGFTLIELLVVVAIIGMLASLVLTSLGTARAKARDAERLTSLDQIQKALELYYVDNQQYPPVDKALSGDSACGTNWCTLETALANYIPVLPRDPRGPQTTYQYYYDADSGDNYQSYGLMLTFESPDNFWRANVDGGFYNDDDCCYFEVGTQPNYCMRRYGSSWWLPAGGNTVDVCNGGS